MTAGIQIQFNELEKMQDVFLTVYNSLGEEVLSQHLNRNYSHRVDLEGLDVGMYICEFRTDGRVVQTERVIVLTP